MTRKLKKEIWPYMVTMDFGQSDKEITDVEIWLGNTMGVFKDKWNIVYDYNTSAFYFKDEMDAVAFKLKWL